MSQILGGVTRRNDRRPGLEAMAVRNKEQRSVAGIGNDLEQRAPLVGVEVIPGFSFP
jgi:hypothetical protein